MPEDFYRWSGPTWLQARPQRCATDLVKVSDPVPQLSKRWATCLLVALCEGEYFPAIHNQFTIIIILCNTYLYQFYTFHYISKFHWNNRHNMSQHLSSCQAAVLFPGFPAWRHDQLVPAHKGCLVFREWLDHQLPATWRACGLRMPCVVTWTHGNYGN